jgi:hypothetical protein
VWFVCGFCGAFLNEIELECSHLFSVTCFDSDLDEWADSLLINDLFNFEKLKVMRAVMQNFKFLTAVKLSIHKFMVINLKKSLTSSATIMTERQSAPHTRHSS